LIHISHASKVIDIVSDYSTRNKICRREIQMNENMIKMRENVLQTSDKISE